MLKVGTQLTYFKKTVKVFLRKILPKEASLIISDLKIQTFGFSF